MKDHGEWKERIADFAGPGVSEQPDGVLGEHLAACEECREELAVLRDLAGIATPDPGDRYWADLPCRVRAGLERYPRRLIVHDWLVRAASLAAAAALLLVLFRFDDALMDMQESELFAADPLAVSFNDYSALRDRDIPPAGELAAAEDFQWEMPAFQGRSYHRDVASLSQEELRSLSELITNIKMNGG